MLLLSSEQLVTDRERALCIVLPVVGIDALTRWQSLAQVQEKPSALATPSPSAESAWAICASCCSIVNGGCSALARILAIKTISMPCHL